MLCGFGLTVVGGCYLMFGLMPPARFMIGYGSFALGAGLGVVR